MVQNFEMWVPINIRKSEPILEGEFKGARRVIGVATDESKDLDDERVMASRFPQAFEYLSKHGKVNLEHRTKDIGDVVNVRWLTNAEAKKAYGPSIEGQAIEVESIIWPIKDLTLMQAANPDLVEAHGLIECDAQLGYSIQGSVLSRTTEKSVSGDIDKVAVPKLVNKIALTTQPKNSNANVNLVKSLCAFGEAIGGIEPEKEVVAVAGEEEAEPVLFLGKAISQESGGEPAAPVEAVSKGFWKTMEDLVTGIIHKSNPAIIVKDISATAVIPIDGTTGGDSLKTSSLNEDGGAVKTTSSNICPRCGSKMSGGTCETCGASKAQKSLGDLLREAAGEQRAIEKAHRGYCAGCKKKMPMVDVTTKGNGSASRAHGKCADCGGDVSAYRSLRKSYEEMADEADDGESGKAQVQDFVKKQSRGPGVKYLGSRPAKRGEGEAHQLHFVNSSYPSGMPSRMVPKPDSGWEGHRLTRTQMELEGHVGNFNATHGAAIYNDNGDLHHVLFGEGLIDTGVAGEKKPKLRKAAGDGEEAEVWSPVTKMLSKHGLMVGSTVAFRHKSGDVHEGKYNGTDAAGYHKFSRDNDEGGGFSMANKLPRGKWEINRKPGQGKAKSDQESDRMGDWSDQESDRMGDWYGRNE